MKLTLALPTGRIFEETQALLERCGIQVSREAVDGRKLYFETANGEATLLLAKDRDVPTYVAHGVAQVGIVGKDVLSEQQVDVYEPLDLGMGRCRMVVARSEHTEPRFYRDLPVVRVATKYPRVATSFFHRDGLPVDVIPLAGSVELAPVLGLADVIVDLVQSGRTLEANGLVVDEELFESTARLIVNRASYRLETEAVRAFIRRIEKAA